MRHARILREGAKYHVIARANRQEMIFNRNKIKDLFLKVLKRAKGKYRFRIENFCIIGNHYHFIIVPGKKECLSRIMQWIQSVFAIHFNKIMHLTGHVWGERFYSRIISGFADFLRTFLYIDNNPVKANQVDQPYLWEYGGLYHSRIGRHDIVEDMSELTSIMFPQHSLLLLS
jgi:putative transposase